jgi:hypothetical protein
MKKILTLLILIFTCTVHAETTKLDFYGFLLTSMNVGVNGVDSLGRNNLVAYSAAANPVLAGYPSRTSGSFQVQQSRLGVKMHFEENIESLFEFDFVDFNKSTPTVASQPRLRQAKVTWTADSWTFNVGQLWDLFSPLAPTTYNYIGHYFLSGDLGFMRLQAQALYKSDQTEQALAIGFPVFNNQTQESMPELSKWPTFSLRQTFYQDHWTYGTSGIIGHLELPNNLRSLTPFAVNLFAQYKDDNDEINFESYYGHNVENLSLQGLSYSATLLKLEEAGAFITIRRKLAESHHVFYGLGYAKILNPNNLSPSYSLVSGRPVFNLISSSSTGYGIAQNATARLGYEYLFRKRMTAFFETAFLYTEHKLDTADQSIWSSFRKAQIFEIGLKLEI